METVVKVVQVSRVVGLAEDETHHVKRLHGVVDEKRAYEEQPNGKMGRKWWSWWSWVRGKRRGGR